jgi:hypothetical protein
MTPSLYQRNQSANVTHESSFFNVYTITIFAIPPHNKIYFSVKIPLLWRKISQLLRTLFIYHDWANIQWLAFIVHGQTFLRALHNYSTCNPNQTVNLHRSDAKFDTWCWSVWHARSVKFSTDAKINQSVNQSINQSIHQSINQSMDNRWIIQHQRQPFFPI